MVVLTAPANPADCRALGRYLLDAAIILGFEMNLELVLRCRNNFFTR